jgi:hypothetical protein
MVQFLWVLITAIFFMSNNASSHLKYKVLSVEELNKIEEAKRIETDTSYIIEYNGAFVTVFKDKTSILAPPVLGGKEGLFFYNVADMDEIIKSRNYPVKGNNSFWEKEKQRVLNFSDEMPYYCSRLTEMLNYKVELNSDKLYLKELSEVVTKKIKVQKDKKKLYNYLSIYIGELLRQRVNGEWKLLPQKALNVYYMPEITKDDKFCSHWSFIIGQLEMASFIPVDIESLIDKANVFYPIANRNYVSK